MTKKVKYPNNKLIKVWLPVVALLLFLVVLILFIQQNQQATLNTSITKESQYKTYTSKGFNITFNIPERFEIREEHADIIIIDSKGVILITRSGTNFDNLDEYLKNLSEINQFSLTNFDKLETNGNDLFHGIINNKKYYFIYPSDSWQVFSITTASQALFSDLDQIAKSFRYTP